MLEDVAAAVRRFTEVEGRPDLLIMPDSFLSRWRRDLLGASCAELEMALGLPIVLIPTERIVL